MGRTASQDSARDFQFRFLYDGFKENAGAKDYNFGLSEFNSTTTNNFRKRKNIFWGDQGLLSAAFVGDVWGYEFPEIRDLWHMPYNFCLWYYDRKNEKPDYIPAIIHYAGTAFKPWKGKYPIYLERFQKENDRLDLSALKLGQAEYYYLWHELALITEGILMQIGF